MLYCVNDCLNPLVVSSAKAPQKVEVVESYGASSRTATVNKGECWTGSYGWQVCLKDYLYVKYTKNANEGSDHVLVVKLDEIHTVLVLHRMNQYNTNVGNWGRAVLKVAEDELANVPSDIYSPPSYEVTSWGYGGGSGKVFERGKILYFSTRHNGSVNYHAQVFFLD